MTFKVGDAVRIKYEVPRVGGLIGEVERIESSGKLVLNLGTMQPLDPGDPNIVHAPADLVEAAWPEEEQS